MKLALVYDMAYPFRLGGGEKRNWELAWRLQVAGDDVRLVSMRMWEGAPEFVRDGVHCVGICARKPRDSGKGKRSFWEPFCFAYHLFFYLRSQEFDLVDCGNFPYLSCIAAKAATLFRKTKLVITWYEARGLKRWVRHKGILGIIAWLFELLVSRLTRANVAISRFTEQRAGRILWIKNIAVIPCGVASVGADRAAAGIVRSDRILYVGRLVKHKRVDLLIEAFCGLSRQFHHYALKIVGDGDCKDELVNLVEKIGLSERATFVDSISEHELNREYAGSKVFVLPSEQEGFGLVLLEAMAAGTPVIALNASASAAKSLIVDRQNGLLVSTQEEMTKALELLLGDKLLYDKLARNGKETARKHDWDEAVVPALKQYYATVLA